MRIRITAKDRKLANEIDGACPATIALRRHFGKRVSIARDYIRVERKKKVKEKYVLIKLPRVVQDYILDYPSNDLLYALLKKDFEFNLSKKDVETIRKYA